MEFNDQVVNVFNVIFQNNKVITLGGAILDYVNNFTHYENITFINNNCIKGQGGDLQVKLTSDTLIKNATSVEAKASGANSLFGELMSGYFIIDNCKFDNSNPEKKYADY